jgi:pyridoxal phosphate enzyme (YggS family)
MTPFEEIRQAVLGAATASGRVPPTLVAVSKRKSVDEILAVYHQGHRIFGENYVQELITKSEEIRSRGIQDLQFHFIGGLQRNKVRVLLPHASLIHSVDSIRLLEEIEKQTRAQAWTGGVLIQVNLDNEETKGGFSPDDLPALAHWVERTRPQVLIQGLMCIPDPARDPSAAFAQLRQLRDQYAGQLGAGLSMGMSSDFADAIANGSTFVRVGSAIFGART